MKHRLRAITFDFGGTLDGPGRDWYSRLKDSSGDGSPEEEFIERCRQAGDALAQTPGVGEMGLSASVRTMCAHLFEEESRAKEVAALFLKGARRWLAKSCPILERLAGRYRLGLVTNNFGNAAGWLSEVGLAPFFSAVADSAVVGASKPDPDIFLRALEELECEPFEAVHVGDSFEKDVAGAAGCGMRAVWLRPRDSTPPEATPHVGIARLDELPEAVSRIERELKKTKRTRTRGIEHGR